MAETAKVKTERAKRGSGPLVVTFGNAEGKLDLKRVGSGVNSVVVTPKGGKAKSYSTDQIPPAVREALVSFALAARVKVFVNNNAKPDGSDVIELTDKIYSDFVNGRIYSRAEGGAKPGKKFDPTDIVEAVRMARDIQAKSGVKSKGDGKLVKPASKAQLDMLTAKMIAFTPKERNAEVKKMTSNALIASCLANIKAQKLSKAAAGAESVEDLF